MINDIRGKIYVAGPNEIHGSGCTSVSRQVNTIVDGSTEIAAN